jgi:hypothetical protein
MRTALMIVLGLVGFVIFGYLFLVWRTLRATARRDKAVQSRVQPIVTRIANLALAESDLAYWLAHAHELGSGAR